jgi:hypothetical protein
MRTSIILLFVVLPTGSMITPTSLQKAGGKGPGAGAPGSPIDDPVTPINKPDFFAWQLFAYANAPAPVQTKVMVGGMLVDTNSALWETWASDQLTFPSRPDPKNPPTWPGPGEPRRFQLRPRALAIKTSSPLHQRFHPQAAIEKPEEEVLRNKPTFEYIITNNLWYTEGLAQFFQKGQPVVFPTQSVEVKANWQRITPDQKPKFHWNYDDKGNLYGLIALHITSKVLPNWFWATFEWVDNPGRSDYIGSGDAFGVVYDNAPPSFQPPLFDQRGRQITGSVYPSGKVSDALLKLFKDAGFTSDWTSQWLNYRLKGSQVDFASSTGIPTLLGNSRTEAGFVPSASCITCHSQASVNAQGKNAFPNTGFKDDLFPVIGPALDSYNGYPNPNWFWQKSLGGPIPKNLQVDFVWAIPTQAHSIKQ